MIDGVAGASTYLKIGRALFCALTAIGWFCAGCDSFVCCPITEPIARAAGRADLRGTWRMSLQYNETTPFNSAQNPPLISDGFLDFDADGELAYAGLLSPDGSLGLWQIDFVAGRASDALRVVRSGVTYDHVDNIMRSVTDASLGADPADPNTSGATVEYALRIHQGFGVVGYELTWRLEDVRADPNGQVLSALLIQTEHELTSPEPPTTTFGGYVWLRRIDTQIEEPSSALDPVSKLTARSGGQIPYPVGTVFDLDASGTQEAEDLTYSWTVHRVSLDEFGRFLGAAAVQTPDGQTSSFTADAAGTYFVRCWVTDGTQWAVGLPLVTRVE